jgi:2-polyprenyl-6-hydroxyphenyl methylase/3-demethylubiquinone-9 3-methyltransferase
VSDRGQTTAAERFEFGENWRQFLSTLGDEQIAEAQRSLAEMLGDRDLVGLTFLDVGSGSGLSSLAARRMGARVHSFDDDPKSVACTQALKARFLANDPNWTIERGSVLDVEYLKSVGKFDIVYAWGVLHHTGALWQAMLNVASCVTDDGRLFIAIYNWQRYWTGLNTAIKRLYNRAPGAIRRLMEWGFIGLRAAKGFIQDLFRLRDPRARYREYKRHRGMSWWYDSIDWLGGYPYEAATPHQVSDFYQARGFELEELVECGNSGCNQFIFRKLGKADRGA